VLKKNHSLRKGSGGEMIAFLGSKITPAKKHLGRTRDVTL
jgi:hypothetical protein